MQIATTSGSLALVQEDEIEQLRATMRGPLLRAGDAGNDPARLAFNGMFRRRPALIARCRGVADVIDVVRFASRRQLLTAVRAGGCIRDLGYFAVASQAFSSSWSCLNISGYSAKTVRRSPGSSFRL